VVTIVTRSGKGSPLTNTEVDTNFTNLNSGKLETTGGSLTGALTVSGSTSTDLVRITQTGAGNALVVEDDTNPDASPFVVTATGDVGIGTSTPLVAANYKFTTVQGGSSGGGYSIYNNSGTEVARFMSDPTLVGLYNYTASLPTLFITNSLVRMSITSSGNVGIGTVTPNEKLSVEGGGIVVNNSAAGSVGFIEIGGDTSALVDLKTPGADDYDLRLFTSNTEHQIYGKNAIPMKFFTNDLERMRITSDGKIGVGTAAPVAQMSVYGTGQNTYTTFNTSTNLGGTLYACDAGSSQYNGGAIMFGANQGAWAAIKGWLNDGNNNTNGGLSIYSRSATTDSTLTERVRVNTNGLTVVYGSIGRSGIVTKTGNFTLADDENWIICNGSGTITVIFPSASPYTTREVMFKTVQNQAVISASSNVLPLAGGAATTSILSATAGKWAKLVSDGTNWIIMQAN